jgi:hypothetical protein
MTHADVQDWLDRYVRAWETYDRTDIEALFSEDATYRYQPWGEPVSGRAAITDDWLAPSGKPEQADAAGTFAAQYEPYAVDADGHAVAVGWTVYWKDAARTEVVRAYHNAYLLEFDADGRCRAFTEYYMETPKRLWPGAASAEVP